jgi:DNA repair exonuclease SbcCD ATPase subunit
MTSTKYLVCLVAQAFGYRKKNIRMAEAAEETYLLKEAESHLGKALWENVKDIEALSTEYWNLRNLIKERERVAVELESRQKKLAEIHQERADLLGISNEPYQELLDKRQTIFDSLEELAKQRDLIVTKAVPIRRAHDGAKTKEEVLTKEGISDEKDFTAITQKIAGLKAQFAELKAEHQKVAAKITEGDVKIDTIDTEILKHKNERRAQASEVFQLIGNANQDIFSLRAELGVIDTQMSQLYTEIGKFISRNSSDPKCRIAGTKMQWLIDVMSALRKSILFNHKLSGNN